MVGKTDERVLVLYARVSGQGQRDDLNTQIVRLEQWAKETHPNQRCVVLSDIGSGLSTTRKQLVRLLKMVCEDRVAEIAITSSDRLTRFGQDYLAVLFESFSVTLTILDPDEEHTPRTGIHFRPPHPDRFVLRSAVWNVFAPTQSARRLCQAGHYRTGAVTWRKIANSLVPHPLA